MPTRDLYTYIYTHESNLFPMPIAAACRFSICYIYIYIYSRGLTGLCFTTYGILSPFFSLSLSLSLSYTLSTAVPSARCSSSNSSSVEGGNRKFCSISRPRARNEIYTPEKRRKGAAGREEGSISSRARERAQRRCSNMNFANYSALNASLVRSLYTHLRSILLLSASLRYR